VVFPSTSPKDLRVNVYDPLRGVPVAELEVRKSYATGKHTNETHHFMGGSLTWAYGSWTDDG